MLRLNPNVTYTPTAAHNKRTWAAVRAILPARQDQVQKLCAALGHADFYGYLVNFERLTEDKKA